MIDPDGPVPVYRQIADLLTEQIECGELPAGRAIPSELAIRQTYGVARGTARRAVEELRERGLVETVPQRGTYVLPPEQRPAAGADPA
jgi:DNA-binding GntR family transcriptional regulator